MMVTQMGTIVIAPTRVAIWGRTVEMRKARFISIAVYTFDTLNEVRIWIAQFRTGAQ